MNVQGEATSLRDQSERAEATNILFWDGRLDNRSDLLLLLRDSFCNDSSNAGLALAAYKRWGTSGFIHLIGDWSVVIRDDANRCTVLASDFAGVRPLYYTVQSGCVLWTSACSLLSTQVESPSSTSNT
jgi:asparagine synthetase B (glutamine-hydrolysing)